MKSKAVIFGCGYRGQHYIEKIALAFDVVAFADNNSALWGNQLMGKPIIPPHEIKSLGEVTVFVCVEKFQGIAQQLANMGIVYVINNDGLYYKYEDMILYPISFSEHEPYRKSGTEFAVLFVQDAPCGRTDKISCVLKAAGIMTQSACFRACSKMPEAYWKENCFETYDALLEFVNDSEFDIVHSSNEPDILANLLLHSNKTIIADVHDLITARNISSSLETYYLEYAANKFADGTMYVTPYYRDLQILRCGVSMERTFTLPNLILESQIPASDKRMQKLSTVDGELHIVYEGGISDNPASHRFFEEIWRTITDACVHIHYYSQQNIDYCKKLEKMSPYLHYEGNRCGLELITEMTKYDAGSLLLNPVDKNAMMAAPNKLYEYLAAGLPVVTNLTAPLEFVTSRQVGGDLDFGGDIQAQLKKIAAIQIQDRYLQENKLTMDSWAEDILAFYKKIVKIGQAKKR